MAYKDQEKKRAYARAYYGARKDLYRQRHLAWKAANPDAFRESQERSRVRLREPKTQEQRNAFQRERYRTDEAYRNRRKATGRRTSLLKFGLMPEDFQDILDEQGGGCAICHATPRNARMAVDHDHRTGLVRGVLCTRCNRALGQFRDDAGLLEEAADYLNRSSSGATSMPSNVPQSWPWTSVAYRIRRSMELSR